MMQNPYPFEIQKRNSDETITFLIYVHENEPSKGWCRANIECRDKQTQSRLGDGKNAGVEGNPKEAVLESIKRILEAYPEYKDASPMP